MAIPDKPLNRIEKYLAKWVGDTVSIPAEPLNRLEKYLAKIAGQNVQTPTPLCRIEDYLDAIIANIQWTEITNESVATYTSSIAAELSKLEIAIDPSLTGWDEAKVFVEAAYDASATPKAVIDLGETRFGGRLDVTTGALTVEWLDVDLGTLDWKHDATTTLAHAFRAQLFGRQLSSVKPGVYGLCDSYNFYGNASTTTLNNSLGDMEFGYQTTTSWVWARNDACDSAEDITGALDGVYLVYELATPQTVQLTPVQVETLVGANAVWADTGDILTLKYREV